MSAFIEDIRAVSELRWIGWPGAVADYWQAEGRKGGRGHYVSPDPRIVVFFEGAPGIGLSASADRPGKARLAYVPAGIPVWSTMHDDRLFSHLDLHFSARMLTRTLAGRATLPEVPVLLERHEGIEQLAGLFLRELQATRDDALVLDSLLMTMIAYFRQMQDRSGGQGARAGGLSPGQHRRVMKLIETRLHGRITVAELAEAAGMSESWFARAFRQTMDETPARSIARLRIERAKALLNDGTQMLVDIAADTGFADQAHFTRVFRIHTGTTPAAWRSAFRA